MQNVDWDSEEGEDEDWLDNPIMGGRVSESTGDDFAAALAQVRAFSCQEMLDVALEVSKWQSRRDLQPTT